MTNLVTSAFGNFQTVVTMMAQLLVGVMMVFFVGLPLAIGGRPEAAVPLILGGLAFCNMVRSLKSRLE